MTRLKESCLMWSEFLELAIEQLVLLTRDRLLVQNQNVGDIIVVNLCC